MLDTDNADWVRKLRTLIERRVGLLVDEHREKDLIRSATRACEHFGYADPAALLRALSDAQDDAPVFEHLIADVTIGESHFFRDEAQMAFLQSEFLPGLIAERRGASRTLRVWSAGASAGQELYSIAIMLDELLDDREAWHLHLLGSDLNVQALRRAIDGYYSAWSLRGLSDTRRRRYFDAAETGGGYRLKPQLRRMARFSYLNLAADEFPRIADDLHAMDLILCRNVFIYFDVARVREILQRMVATLAPSGVLLLGASDLVSPEIPGLKIVMRPGMCFYRKPTQAPVPVSAPAPDRAPVRAPAAASRAHSGTRAATGASSARPASEARAPASRNDLLATVRTLERAQRWDEIARLAQEQPERLAAQTDSALAASRAFGNLGELDTALHWCEIVLQRAQTDPNAHFLRALLLHEAGRTDDALHAFRRAVFLQPDFVLAHYQYALLQLNTGRRERGLRSLETVRRLLAAAPADRELQGAEHLSYGRLAQVIDNELSLHHEYRPA